MEYYRINEIYVKDFADKGEYETKIKFNYDEKGFLIKTSSKPKSTITDYEGKYYETKYIYDKDGLLLLTEEYLNDNKYRYSQYIYDFYKGNELKRSLVKIMDYYSNNKLKRQYIFINDNGKNIKILKCTPENMIEYEYIQQYEDNKKIRTLKANLELYSSREYDERGLLKEINYTAGQKATYTWEIGFSNYDYDNYHFC